jgi:hypothetical protein
MVKLVLQNWQKTIVNRWNQLMDEFDECQEMLDYTLSTVRKNIGLEHDAYFYNKTIPKKTK